jgi:hypothetical protein
MAPKYDRLTRRQQEQEGYLMEVNRFSDWCAKRRLPFKWAMVRAMRSFRARFKHRDGPELDEAIDRWMEKLREQLDREGRL